MQFLPYLKHLHICLQSAAFERISQAWDSWRKLPSQTRLGVSYRHLRGWESLGPDQGFSREPRLPGAGAVLSLHNTHYYCVLK